MSLIIPLALKSISTVVPPIIIAGDIIELLVKNQKTYVGGYFDNITGVDRNDLASFDNDTKTINSFYQGEAKLNPYYGVFGMSVMKTPSNNDVIVVSDGLKIRQLNSTTGVTVSSGPSYNNNYINEYFIDPNINNSEIFGAGTFITIGSLTRDGFVKFNNNLSINSTFTCRPNPVATVFALCSSHLTTHIYAGGSFNTIRSVGRKRIARVRKTDGAVDTTFTFSSVGSDAIYSMSLSSNGRLFVGGTSDNQVTSLGRPLIRCLNTNGTIFSNLTANIPLVPGTLSYCSNIKVNNSEQKIYTSIESSYPLSGNPGVGPYLSILARFNTDGTLDTSFNSPSGFVPFILQGGQARINFDFDYDNNLIPVGGHFSWIGNWDYTSGNSVSNFAYLSSDGSFVS